MALRAGYYGLKRKFARLINTENIIPETAGIDNPLVTDYQYTKAVNYDYRMGVKNILPDSPTKSRTDQGITFTVNDDGSVSISGTSSATAVLRYSIAVKAGTYQLWGRYNDDIWVGMYDTSQNKYIISTASSDGVMWDVPNDLADIRMTVRVGHPTTIPVGQSIKIYPMLTISGSNGTPISDNKYYSYARSNRELTLESDTQSATLDEHKTEINAIISAATGAADFAAFKTAMGALTPLTRSAAPAERSLQIEEAPEEEAPAKKTTKRSTKKATTTEEEV